MENVNVWSKECPRCGNIQNYKNEAQLKKGIKNKTSCSVCCSKNRRIDLTGKKYGRLSVISYAGNSKWKCLCECGNTTDVRVQHLISNGTKSCGCHIHDQRPQIQTTKPFEWILKELIRRANKKGYEVKITYEEMLSYTKIKCCHYCGDEIKWYERKRGCKSARYNLDRKDNALGYTKENCVVCCKECNYTKSNYFTYNEMLKIGEIIGEVKRNRKSN